MTIRVYVSGLSGNQEVKKRQQRIQTVLESCAVPFQLVDITEAGREQDRSFMQQHATAREGDRNPLPPQIFNEATYCGDFVGFDEANETDQLYQFLRLSEQEIGSAQQTLSDKRQQSASRPIDDEVKDGDREA